ncbi:MAG: DUF4118 domain-containing protein [Synergistaceae bacterium]|nr:DUF4118 domain-containing protein [Synergistaceae bacterium]
MVLSHFRSNRDDLRFIPAPEDAMVRKKLLVVFRAASGDWIFPSRTGICRGKGHRALRQRLVIPFVASVFGDFPTLVEAVSFRTRDVFFLPPYKTSRVDDPKDWISLGGPLMVGVRIGLTSGRLREREALAVSPGKGQSPSQPADRAPARDSRTPRDGGNALRRDRERLFPSICPFPPGGK